MYLRSTSLIPNFHLGCITLPTYRISFAILKKFLKRSFIILRILDNKAKFYFLSTLTKVTVNKLLAYTYRGTKQENISTILH